MITFKILRFPFVVCVSHTVIVETKFLELAMSLLDFSPRIPLGTFSILLVTDIVLIITSQEDLILTLLHIGSRLFELFSKEVRVKKQPGRHLICIACGDF